MRQIVTLAVLALPGVCLAWTEFSLWRVSAGAERVIEFVAERDRPFCGDRCYAFAARGRPDEIFVSTAGKDLLSRLHRGEVKIGRSPEVFVLHMKERTVQSMPFEAFVALDILFEDLPIRGHEAYPGFAYGGDPNGHRYVAPISKGGEAFVATLSSARSTSERTTFGIPGIIPFFGRDKWFQKESSHRGTFFLEVFDASDPARPIVQLQKAFRDVWLLPTVFQMASWTQGAKEPLLVVVDRDNPIREKRERILVIRCQ